MHSLNIPRIHPAGYPFIILFAIGTLILFLLAQLLGWIGVLLTLWCIWFFRDPERFPPSRDNAVVSPADGVVQMVDLAAAPPELGLGDTQRARVAVFMNVFNVHVNRAPCAGTITALNYRPGKFFNAALDKASRDNERQSIAMTTTGGQELVFVQIAGLVARRILCDLTEGQPVATAERIGLIRFGSRVDVYLPPGVVPLVRPGQTMVAGETVIAELGET